MALGGVSLPRLFVSAHSGQGVAELRGLLAQQYAGKLAQSEAGLAGVGLEEAERTGLTAGLSAVGHGP
jgi:hypothetical protein